MIVVVNGVEVEYKSVIVDVNKDEIARQFTIINNEEKPSFKKGDIVQIFNSNRILLIDGDIEYIKMKGETSKEYVGRNKAKYIVDCYSDKTIQFSEGLTVQTVLEEVAGRFGLKVIGEAEMPKETLPKIEIGEMFGDSLMDIIESAGQVITSDAYGNIEIEDEPEERDLEFTYGENIRSRDYEEDSTVEYDKCICVSQSAYNKLRLAQKTRVKTQIKGEYGDGDFIRVVKSKDALTEEECIKTAKKEWEKDRRSGLKYTVEMDNIYDIDVHKLYRVKDNSAGIDEMLVVQSFSASSSESEDVLKVRFERYVND